MHCVAGICVVDGGDIEALIPIDYESASWREWADILDELLAPIFDRLGELQAGIEENQAQACGEITEDDHFVPSSDDVTFSESQTTLERLYNIGLAIGKPIGYVRVLSGMGVLGLNYITVLLGYFLTAFAVFSFTAIYAISVRMIMGLARLIKWLYEWIPAKAT